MNDSAVADDVRNKPKKLENPELRFLQRSEYDFNIQVQKLRQNILFFQADRIGSTNYVNLMGEIVRKDLDR